MLYVNIVHFWAKLNKGIIFIVPEKNRMFDMGS